jgi:hypothetical protein
MTIIPQQKKWTGKETTSRSGITIQNGQGIRTGKRVTYNTRDGKHKTDPVAVGK